MQINQVTNQNLVFGEKRKPGNLGKNQRSREKNLPEQSRADKQQTQPTYGVEAEIEPTVGHIGGRGGGGGGGAPTIALTPLQWIVI